MNSALLEGIHLLPLHVTIDRPEWLNSARADGFGTQLGVATPHWPTSFPP